MSLQELKGNWVKDETILLSASGQRLWFGLRGEVGNPQVAVNISKLGHRLLLAFGRKARCFEGALWSIIDVTHAVTLALRQLEIRMMPYRGFDFGRDRKRIHFSAER